MPDPRPHCWRIFAYPPGGQRVDPVDKPDLEWAKNYANKVWPVGLVVVEHIATKEEHRRKGGQWMQTRLAVQPELSLGNEK